MSLKAKTVGEINGKNDEVDADGLLTLQSLLIEAEKEGRENNQGLKAQGYRLALFPYDLGKNGNRNCPKKVTKTKQKMHEN